MSSTPPYQPYQQPNQPPFAPPQSSLAPKKGLAIIALILAFLFPPLGIVLGIVALIMASKDPQRYGGKGLAIGSILTSIAVLAVSIVIALTLGIATLAALSGSSPQPRATYGNAKSYVNSRSNFTGNRAESYADFSFSYPNSWTIDPSTKQPNSPNFVKVVKNTPDEFTMENFAVGSFTGTGSAAGDQLLLPQLVDGLSSQLSKGFPNYQKVSEGRIHVGSYDGYEFRFTALAKGTPKGDIPFWGRVVIIPNVAGKKNGVALTMLATSLAPGVRSVSDVGVTGELPLILNSFRLK